MAGWKRGRGDAARTPRRWAPLAVGAAVGIVAAGVVALWLRPADPREPARRFLDAAAQGQFERAADELEAAFRQQVPPADLRAFLEGNGIEAPSEVRWTGYCVRGESGEAYAALAPEGGSPVAVKLGLESDDGRWRVVSVRAEPASGASTTPPFGVPTDAEFRALIRQTTREFASAVAARDLTLFLRTTARAFRERFSAREFEAAFGGFVEQQVNLGALEQFDPVLIRPPALDPSSGVLTLEGYYPTQPSQVRFRYEYAYRHIGWQLVGIDLSVGPAGS